MNKVLEAILKYDNLSLDDFPSMTPERRKYIQEKIKRTPAVPHGPTPTPTPAVPSQQKSDTPARATAEIGKPTGTPVREENGAGMSSKEETPAIRIPDVTEIMPQAKKKNIIEKESSLNAAKLLEAILKYDNLTLDDFPNMSQEKRMYIKRELDKLPNPEEQKAWKDIITLKSRYDISQKESDLMVLRRIVESFLDRWRNTMAADNHVEEAQRLKAEIDGLAIASEEKRWNGINKSDKHDLIAYLKQNPSTSHAQEIDDLLWRLLLDEVVREERSDGIFEYRIHFPKGQHMYDSENAELALNHWLNVKSSGDIFLVDRYTKHNLKSIFQGKASSVLHEMKEAEIEKMKKDPGSYDVSYLMKLIKEGVFPERELIYNGVITKKVLETLRNANIYDDLPDINAAVEDSVPECREGFTDIFFFGVPSTGKTCILMGLSGAKTIHVNKAHGGGAYASALQQFIDAGMTLPQTNSGVVATLETTVYDDDFKTQQKVNLIEMAGEDFARSIAANKERIYDFESMGTGATELLKNNNRKLFFLVIDPTTNIIRYKAKVVREYDEYTGKPVYDLVKVRCNQQELIKKMIDLFAHPNNREIMKKVDGIHFIMTKADLLGAPHEREKKALEKFMSDYGYVVAQRIVELGRRYNINLTTDYAPDLHAFSLGKFYVGGLYEYDPTDADKLIRYIRKYLNPVQNSKR